MSHLCIKFESQCILSLPCIYYSSIADSHEKALFSSMKRLFLITSREAQQGLPSHGYWR